MTLPPLPHLGSTGVVNVPGVREQLAQSLGSLPEILLAVEQQKIAKQNAEAYQAQVAAQAAQAKARMDQEQAQAAEAARLQGLVGKGLSSLAGLTFGGQETSQSNGPAMPAVPGIQQLPTSAAVPPTLDETLAGIDAAALPIVLDKGKDLIKAKRDEEKQAKDRKKFEQVLATLPAETRQALDTVANLPEAIPAAVRERLIDQLLGPSKKEVKQLIVQGYNAGWTFGESEAFATDQPGGPKKGAKKPLLDPMAMALFRNQIDREMGVPNQAEQTAFRNGVTMVQAARNLEKAKPINRAALAALTAKRPTVAEFVKMAVPDQYKASYQAIRAFIDPLLRTETGAAFAQNEIGMVIDRYIDVSDDPAELKATKKQARHTVLNAIFGEAGRAINDQIRRGRFKQKDWDEIQNYLDEQDAPPPNPWR